MMIERVALDDIFPDESNPRKADEMRSNLLRISLAKMGFVQPIFCNQYCMVLSGHQRHARARELGFRTAPVIYVDISEKNQKGINVQFNRATNDFTAFDTGSNSTDKIDITSLMRQAEGMPDFDGEEWFAYGCEDRSIVGVGKDMADKYNRKSLLIASSMRRKGVKIPIVRTPTGRVINGVFRLFEARHEGITEWPTIEIPEDIGDFASNMLNYLSMDYAVDGEFAQLLRYSAYRRPQNNRGRLPKSYRFWANGCKTLRDADSYSTNYWRKFRTMHGDYVCDFGAGLCKVGPYLRSKGVECVDFEPFRINPDTEAHVPDPGYSREKASEFLDEVAEGRPFSSIFLASVMNSIPFPRDRQCVLAIVHALCGIKTAVYGTCRDISDYNYEYSGIRNAGYFVFDSEPGVRLGDALSNPKIQKFHTQEEFKAIAGHFWNNIECWPGGNVFYWKATAPKMKNAKVMSAALLFEFEELCLSDGESMGLGDKALQSFSHRLGITLSRK